ncbi:MAG: hypothetical protein IT447_14065 [Phycisphaerales bacterium]|jgi:hypothetical protein|nr:hypothetical protein [Phycisphaerales bacterium]
MTSIRQSVIVQPGGVVEVRSPQLKVGAQADVTVVIEDQPSTQRRTLVSFIGSGMGLFNNAHEIDAQIRELRDEWDQ